MRSHGFWGKLTAMLLALMLALPGSFVAFAEGNEKVIDGDVSESVWVYADEYSGDGSLTVNGNITVVPEDDEKIWMNGAYASANGDAEASLTVNGTVTVESNAGASAVEVSVNDGGVAEVSVGDLSVSTAYSGSALSVNANDGTVTVEAGQLNAESSGEGYWDKAAGLSVQTNSEDATANVTVGDIQADTGISANNDGGSITVSAGVIEADETGIRVYSNNTFEELLENLTEEEFSAAVSGLEPSGTWDNGDGTSSISYYQDDVWYYDHGENSTNRYERQTHTEIESSGTTEINVDSISVTSTDDDYAHAVNIYNDAMSDVTVTVGGDVALEAENGQAIGVNNYGGGNVSVNVDGDVTSTAGGVYTYSDGGDVTVEIGGDVQTQGTGVGLHQSISTTRTYLDIEPEKGESDEIVGWHSVYDEETETWEDVPSGWYNPDKDYYYDSEGAVWTLTKENSEGSMTVHVDGDVSAEGETYVVGVSASNSNEDSPAALSIGGDVSAKAEMSVTGVSANASGGAALDVEIQGKVTATQAGAEKGADDSDESDPYVAGVRGNVYDGGVLSIEVMGGIEASGEMDAAGIALDIYDKDSSVNADIKGDITAEGKGDVQGISAYVDSGTFDIGVTGNVTSSGDGMILTSAPWKEWEKTDVKLTTDENEYIRTAHWTDDDGNEVSEKYYRHVDGDKVYWYNEKGDAWIETPGEETAAADIKAEIVGDVSAKQDAVVIDVTNDKAAVDLIVDGTVSGDKNAVVLEETTLADNVTLTVWEIKPNANGSLVERYKDVMTDEEKYEFDRKYLGADTAVEQAIQYIIRIEQPEKGGTLSADGTKDYEGYKVAKQGDNLILKVNLEKDYEIVSAFNGTDTKVQLLKDANGNYYLVVPRGGGVCLSVNLRYVAPKATAKPDLKAMAEAASENGVVTIETDEKGAKVIIVTAEEGAENVSMALGYKTLKTFASWNVSTILLRNEDGTAEVRLPVASLLSAVAAKAGSEIIIVMDNPGKVSESVAEALKEKYDLTESTPVVVTILLRHQDGTETELESADISLKLKADHQDGMEIIHVDRQDAVSETEAEWTKPAGEESGYWKIPYVTSGTYLPVLPK